MPLSRDDMWGGFVKEFQSNVSMVEEHERNKKPRHKLISYITGRDHPGLDPEWGSSEVKR